MMPCSRDGFSSFAEPAQDVGREAERGHQRMRASPLTHGMDATAPTVR